MANKYYMSLVLAVFIIALSSTTVQAQDTTITFQEKSRPIQIALFAPIQILPETDFIHGFRFDLIYGRNTSITGLDLGFINHLTMGFSEGVQVGFVNMIENDYTGWQCGFINLTKNNFEGFQSGLFNYAKMIKGVQFGLVNYVGDINGLQIGLVNINEKSYDFPVLPIVHWSF
jgi:hypothetical protein